MELIAAATLGAFESAISKSMLREVEVRRHPLNFLAARVEDDTGRALRLHLWDERFRFNQIGLEVHDHRFDYESFVVDGVVEQTIYKAIPDPKGNFEILEVCYSNNGSALQRSGRFLQLAEQRREIYSAGAQYGLSHGVLHRLDLVSPSAVTLVLTCDVDGRPITIGHSKGDHAPSTLRPPVCDTAGNLMTLSTHSISQIVEAAL